MLELGAGEGLHTYSLIKTGANVIATDISQNALCELKNNFLTVDISRLHIMVADMEQLPFENKSFDIVANVNSLSYGAHEKIDKEIRRIIKPGGYFICLDSLNNNPIYNINRYLYSYNNRRSRSNLSN